LKIENLKLKIKSGFTMIEILIVIAVLGILAVAVLSAINPIEQINRSKDTGLRSDAEQLISATDRFYATTGYYPWRSSPDDTNQYAVNTMTNMRATSGTGNDILTRLSNSTSELKSAFVSRITATGYNTLWLYNRGTQGDSTYVCFVPQSGAFQTEAVDRCNGTKGSIPADLSPANSVICPGQAANTYSCLP